MEPASTRTYLSGPQYRRLRDVWSHALFLVEEAYDWQGALTQFELLEKEAPNSQIKAILLLNIGIIHSLMAEYQQAENVFKKALSLHPSTSPLAHYMLGLVRFELADFEQAQISFKLCAYVLKQTDPHRSYHALGLDFVLSYDQVVENEEIAAHEWTLKQKGRHGTFLLNRLPASLIFRPVALENPAGDVPSEITNATGTRMARPLVRHYAPPNSVLRTRSDVMMSMVENATIQAAKPDPPIEIRRPVPQRPARRRHMIPRTARSETSDLRLLTHFFKHTGPDSLESFKEGGFTNSVSMSPKLDTVQINQSHVANTPYVSNPNSQNEPVRLQQAHQRSSTDCNVSGRPRLLRRFPTLTLRRTTSIRQMARNAFNTPIDQFGSSGSSSSSNAANDRSMIYRPGPRRQPTMQANGDRVPFQQAKFFTVVTEDGESSREEQIGEESRVSMDSHLIFSQGRRIM